MSNERHRALTITLLAIVTVTFFGAVTGTTLGFLLGGGDDGQQDTTANEASVAQTAPAEEPTPTQEPPADPNAVQGKGVALSLAETNVKRDLRGVEVLVEVENRRDTDVQFFFTPSDSVEVTDAEGTRYNLQWAEYAAEMTVPPGERVKLIRAFFTGPLPEDDATLNVRVLHVPGVGDATWEVPVQ